MDSNEIIEKIQSQSQKYINKLEIFDVSLTIPSSTIIRNYKVACILKYLFSKFENLKEDPFRITSIKERFKKKLISAIEDKGFKYGSSNLKIHLDFEHVESQKEFFELYPHVNPLDYKISRTNIEKKASDIIENEDFNKKSIRNIIKSNRLNANLESGKYITIRLKKVGEELFNFKKGDDPHQILKKFTSKAECTIKFQFMSIFVCGRYVKYARGIPQTNKLDDEEHFYNESVESLICPTVCNYFCGDKYIFSTAGREDIDVRMLGRGRSFMIEIVNPKNNLSISDLYDLQSYINKNSYNKVWINDLQMTEKSGRERLKEGENKKSKRYDCIVFFRKPLKKESLNLLENISNLKINQRTPIRVLHKRSLSTREKVIFSINYEYIDSHHARFIIESQAGTYIKEFINGDFGRTKPNLADLLNHEEAFLTLLDVLEVKIDWPDKIEREKNPPPVDILDEHFCQS